MYHIVPALCRTDRQEVNHIDRHNLDYLNGTGLAPDTWHRGKNRLIFYFLLLLLQLFFLNNSTTRLSASAKVPRCISITIYIFIFFFRCQEEKIEVNIYNTSFLLYYKIPIHTYQHTHLSFCKQPIN